MNKKFSWNTTVVYNLPYTISLGIPSSVTIPNYEEIFTKVEDKLSSMTTYADAEATMANLKKKFDNK